MSTDYQKELHERDLDIIRLNNVGLSLLTISQIIGCHPSTITHRLRKLGITAMDTRKAFMENVIAELTEDEQQWLVEILDERQLNIKELIVKLIKHKYSQVQEAKNVE